MTSSLTLTGPTRFMPLVSQVNATRMSLNVDRPTCFHTPMQKLLVMGGAARVHDLGTIGVPGCVTGVDHRAVRDSGCVLGRERNLPQSHNRGVFGVIGAERE